MSMYACFAVLLSPGYILTEIGGLKQAYHDTSIMQCLCKSLDGIT